MEEIKDKTFEGAVVDGRKFPFIRLTVTSSAKTLKKLLPPLFNFRDVFNKSGIKKRWWIKVRGIAFQKNIAWKLFGIVPHELRCSVIRPEKAEEIEIDFFVYAGVIVKEYERLLLSANPSLTVSQNKKEKV